MLEFGSFALQQDQQFAVEASFDTRSSVLLVKQLPYLRELGLRLHINCSEFNPLYRPDFPSLTRLRFRGSGSKNKVLREMLQSYPKIQILHLGYGYDNNPDSSMLMNGTWKQAADLEVMIIDGAYGRVEAPEHPSVLGFKDTRITVARLQQPWKRLELVYNMPDIASHMSPRAGWIRSLPMEVVVKVERNWHH